MNTFLHVREDGRIVLSRPGEAHEATPETSCALDLADRGGMIGAEVARILGLSRERISKIEEQLLRKLAGRAGASLAELNGGLGEHPW